MVILDYRITGGFHFSFVPVYIFKKHFLWWLYISSVIRKKIQEILQMEKGAYSAWEGTTSRRAALGSSVARILPYPGHQRSHLRLQPRWLSSSLRWPGLSKDLSAPWRSISHFRSLASPTPTINSVSVSPISLHILVPETTTDAARMVN